MRKDLIFFLPGILGSEMWFQGQEVWTLKKIIGIAASSFIGNLEQYQATFDLLKLHKEDESSLELDDGVTTPSVLKQETHIPQWVPLFGKTNVYDDMLASLSKLGSCVDQFVPFPYDWRRSIRVLAKRFEQVAREKLRSWRLAQGEDAKLFIVGHSMGGLIATYFCEVLDGWRDTAHLITLGTPHQGAVKPVQALIDGSPIFSADMIRSCTSIYHLATPTAALRTPEGLRAFKDSLSLDQARDRFEDSWNLYQEIADARAQNSRQEYDHDFKMSVVRSTRLRTVQALDSTELGAPLSPLFRIDSSVGGDGTIPTFASLPQGWLGAPIEVCQEHAWLANSRGAIEFVKDAWNQTVRNTEAYQGVPSLLEELEAPEVLSSDKPLLLKIVAKTVQGQLKIRLSAKNRPPEEHEFPCQGEDADDIEWPTPLTPGDYRVDVWLDSESENSALTSSVSVR